MLSNTYFDVIVNSPTSLRPHFALDLAHCPHCGGALAIIAAIEDPTVIVKILAHLGLPTHGPAPARRLHADRLSPPDAGFVQKPIGALWPFLLFTRPPGHAQLGLPPQQ